jgi:hypothetical protein
MAQLSFRALSNITPTKNTDLMWAAFSNPYSEANPDGVVFMGIAENKLMFAFTYSLLHLTQKPTFSGIQK